MRFAPDRDTGSKKAPASRRFSQFQNRFDQLKLPPPPCNAILELYGESP
jgi:hypothetical protein